MEVETIEQAQELCYQWYEIYSNSVTCCQILKVEGNDEFGSGIAAEMFMGESTDEAEALELYDEEGFGELLMKISPLAFTLPKYGCEDAIFHPDYGFCQEC